MPHGKSSSPAVTFRRRSKRNKLDFKSYTAEPGVDTGGSIMFRIGFLLGFLSVLLSPLMHAAQFAPSLVPPNPLYQHPAYGYQLNFGATVPTAFGRTFVGLTVPLTRAPQIFSPNMGYSAPYSWSGGRVPSTGYMTGSIGRYDSYSVQRDFEKAQRDATLNWCNPDAARNLINNQWAYEKIGMTPAAAAAASKDNTEALMTALHARRKRRSLRAKHSTTSWPRSWRRKRREARASRHFFHRKFWARFASLARRGKS